MVVDLTNTDRYYDGNIEFEQKGVVQSITFENRSLIKSICSPGMGLQLILN